MTDIKDAPERPTEHEHAWSRHQNVTTTGHVMPAYETCDCGEARPADVPERPTEDIALRAHRAAVQHLQNLTEAMWAEGDGDDIDWAELGAVAPYDGCDDCLVREIATTVIAELEAAGAIRVLNHDDEQGEQA